MNKYALHAYSSREPPVGGAEQACADLPVLECRSFKSAGARITHLSSHDERPASTMVLLSETLFRRLLRTARALGLQKRGGRRRGLDIKV